MDAAANAAVVGIGPLRRILVSKALLDDYSDDEIAEWDKADKLSDRERARILDRLGGKE